MIVLFILAGIVALFFLLMSIAMFSIKDSVLNATYYCDVKEMMETFKYHYVADFANLGFAFLNWFAISLTKRLAAVTPCMYIFLIAAGISIVYKIIYFFTHMVYFRMRLIMIKYYKEVRAERGDGVETLRNERYLFWHYKAFQKHKEYLKYFTKNQK